MPQLYPRPSIDEVNVKFLLCWLWQSDGNGVWGVRDGDVAFVEGEGLFADELALGILLAYGLLDTEGIGLLLIIDDVHKHVCPPVTIGRRSAVGEEVDDQSTVLVFFCRALEECEFAGKAEGLKSGLDDVEVAEVV